MKKKTCTLCGFPWPIVDFGKKGKGRSPWCKRCQSKRSKKYYRQLGPGGRAKAKARTSANRRRRNAEQRARLWAYFVEHPCVDCGETDPLVLEFDHVRGKKIDIVSRLMNHGRPWAMIVAEIKKCDVRCANCHRRKTAREQGFYKGLVDERAR